MVAISLYRGNLHRVPDAPRKWLMPTPVISPKDFKTLLQRRNKALGGLRSSSRPTAAAGAGNPSPGGGGGGVDSEQHAQAPEGTHVSASPAEDRERAGPSKDAVSRVSEVREEKELVGADCSAKPADGSDSSPPEKVPEGADGVEDSQAVADEKMEANPDGKRNTNVELLKDKEEQRKREIEEKLEVLKGKKHKLVQVLKQILNVEEELKRRNTLHGMAVRPPALLPVEASVDSGSITRHAATRLGAEVNVGVDVEGGETDDITNQNVLSRPLFRMSSTSPSSESPVRRAAFIQQHVVSHSARANMGTTVSPSRFAPAGQSHPSNLPTVSVSVTNFIASSPSPAASGGTSVFRDSRHPSPWN